MVNSWDQTRESNKKKANILFDGGTPQIAIGLCSISFC